MSKTVAVTGASAGSGRATAGLFAAKGARVALTAETAGSAVTRAVGAVKHAARKRDQ